MREYRRFRLFFAWDYRREEVWINRMAQTRGWQLKEVGLCRYVFEPGERGAYLYRLELLRRVSEDEAEKHYLRTVGAEEVCRNGDWGYYRISAARGPFSQYVCCRSKLRYLQGIWRQYVAFCAAVYVALGIEMSAFLGAVMTAPHLLVLSALTLLALGASVGLTRFHLELRRLRRGAREEERGQHPEE